MRSPKDIISDIKNVNVLRHEETDSEKLDFITKAIKTVRSSSTQSVSIEPEDLQKQRAESERLSRLVTPTALVQVETRMIDGIPCEWIRPKFSHRKDKIILYCHGGGYTNGGLAYARILAVKFATNLDLEVVDFQYRLAPEHPYPAAIEDAEKVWNHLQWIGYGAKDIILAGDSAGGNLALELCLRLKEQSRILPKAMVLMSPWTDMRLTGNSYNTQADKDPMLTYEYIEAMRGAYLNGAQDYENPSYSPLLADLSKMPPTLIQVGSREILRDDSEGLNKKYCKYGSMSVLEVYQGCWHVFQQMPINKAHQAMEKVREFVDEVL